MATVNFEVIEGGGCGPQISLSDAAVTYLDSLPTEVSAKLADGAAKAIASAIRLLVKMASVSFSPREESIALAALTCDHVTFVVDDHALGFELTVCEKRLGCHLLSIRQLSEVTYFQRHSISSEINH